MQAKSGFYAKSNLRLPVLGQKCENILKKVLTFQKYWFILVITFFYREAQDLCYEYANPIDKTHLKRTPMVLVLKCGFFAF
jgi:hypothetical protein